MIRHAIRRLLRAKDRMDAASHEAWPIERLAAVSGVSQAHFARSFKRAGTGIDWLLGAGLRPGTASRS